MVRTDVDTIRLYSTFFHPVEYCDANSPIARIPALSYEIADHEIVISFCPAFIIVMKKFVAVV
jgi:hypothetical protein